MTALETWQAELWSAPGFRNAVRSAQDRWSRISDEFFLTLENDFRHVDGKECRDVGEHGHYVGPGGREYAGLTELALDVAGRFVRSRRIRDAGTRDDVRSEALQAVLRSPHTLIGYHRGTKRAGDFGKLLWTVTKNRVRKALQERGDQTCHRLELLQKHAQQSKRPKSLHDVAAPPVPRATELDEELEAAVKASTGTVRRILSAIADMVKQGDFKPTQAKVSRQTGLHRGTVADHWGTIQEIFSRRLGA